MGPGQPVQKADHAYVLYTGAALAGGAWCALAAVSFQPTGVGVGVGAAIQLALGTLFISRALRPLHEMGQVAPYVNREVLAAASAAVREECRRVKRDGADVEAGGPTEMVPVDSLPADTSAFLVKAKAERAAAHAKTAWFKGCACGTASDTAAAERRAAARELGRLDEALRDEWASQLARWAKFHGCVLMGALDAKAQHGREIELFLRDALTEREGAAMCAAALPRGRLDRLRSDDLARLATLAAAESERREQERRREELAQIREERLISLQSRARDAAMEHKAFLERAADEWAAALQAARASVTTQRLALARRQPDARAAAERLSAELDNLIRVDPGSDLAIDNVAMAFARERLSAVLESSAQAADALGGLADQFVDVGALRSTEEVPTS